MRISESQLRRVVKRLVKEAVASPAAPPAAAGGNYRPMNPELQKELASLVCGDANDAPGGDAGDYNAPIRAAMLKLPIFKDAPPAELLPKKDFMNSRKGTQAALSAIRYLDSSGGGALNFMQKVLGPARWKKYTRYLMQDMGSDYASEFMDDPSSPFYDENRGREGDFGPSYY